MQQGRAADESWKLERRTYWLYRIWDAEGRLLYIGVTSRPVAVRIQEHRDTQKWSYLIHVWDYEMMFGGSEVIYAVAEQEELRAIQIERPLANKQGNGMRGEIFESQLRSFNGPEPVLVLLSAAAVLFFICWAVFWLSVP